MSGVIGPAGDGGMGPVDDGGGFTLGHIGLLGEAKHVRAAWVSAFAGQRHGVFAAGPGGVQKVVGGCERPLAGGVVQSFCMLSISAAVI